MRSLLTLLFLGCLNIAYGQCENIHIVPLKEYLVCGMYAPFSISHCFDEPISENEIEVFQYDYSFDSITKDYITGPVELKVIKSNDYFTITKKNKASWKLTLTKMALSVLKRYKSNLFPSKQE